MDGREPAGTGRALAADPVPFPTGRPIVFYAPHQDDETLWMGQVIAHHVLAGREVHVVLCSTGATSTAKDAINGLSGNSWWGWHHNPAREGYTPLSTDAFIDARDREYVAACGQLGVQPINVHIATGRSDSITGAWAETMIASYATMFPDAGHYTTWWGDIHPDHAALGHALKQLHAANPTRYADVRWLTKPAQAASAGASAYALPAASAAEVKRMSIRAGWCYRAWAPPRAYAVGYHSVSDLFAAVEQGAPNWIVRP